MNRIINTFSKKIDYTKIYAQNDEFKPNGLWYSLNGEWEKWCEENELDWVKPINIHINIDETKLLILKSFPEITNFISQYKYEICAGLWYINWKLISENYSGIEIQNYNEIKNQFYRSWYFPFQSWFYGWDVSSGCIWDLSIITELDIKIKEQNALKLH
jgi:hypothetical protein